MRVRFRCNIAGDIRLQCLRDLKDSKQISPGNGRPLVCSSIFQELKRGILRRYRPGFGNDTTKNRFPKPARAFIRELGAVVDMAPRENVVFLTGTLAGSTDVACSALASWSGWVVQTLLQWVRDYTVSGRVFGVWEYQKRGALHVHLCVECPSKAGAALIKSRWKNRWIKCLDGIAKRSGVDIYERKFGGTWAGEKHQTRTDAQTVERSVSRYLAKYLSKGSVAAMGRCFYPPSRWWFASRSLRREVLSLRKEVTVEAISSETALDLFERIGSVMATHGEKLFAYSLPHDKVQKGIILLSNAIGASLLFDFIANQLRCLSPYQASEAPHVVAPIHWWLALFKGRLTGPSYVAA